MGTVTITVAIVRETAHAVPLIVGRLRDQGFCLGLLETG
jgi:hypothetical protein